MYPMELKSHINTTAKMFEDLKGKRILVVGASRGIGKQLAVTLAALGASLSIAGRNVELLNELKLQLECESYICDIDDEDQVKQLSGLLPKLDGLCIVSGFVKLIPPKMLSKKMVDAQVITNLASPLSLFGALLRKNVINDGASIIFTSAAGRLCQPPCTAPYAGAKLGLHGAARSLASDLGQRKIRVNTVSFDYVDTDMIKSIDQMDTDTIGVAPVEYSPIPYLFLLSEMSRWTSGQIIAADAGRMLGKVRYV
jgi:NAD(P)-dependent dehydrogenase (short-subunit alcohol dehydrogenase family)